MKFLIVNVILSCFANLAIGQEFALFERRNKEGFSIITKSETGERMSAVVFTNRAGEGQIAAFYPGGFNNKTLEFLQAYPNLVEVRLPITKDARLSFFELGLLKNHKHLKKLCIVKADAGFGNDDFNALDNLPQELDLELRCVNFPEELIRSLAKVNKIGNIHSVTIFMHSEQVEIKAEHLVALGEILWVRKITLVLQRYRTEYGQRLLKMAEDLLPERQSLSIEMRSVAELSR